MVVLQAYRALAKKLHPDKAVKQGVTKREAEKRFHDLAEAYEVGYPSFSDSTHFLRRRHLLHFDRSSDGDAALTFPHVVNQKQARQA